MATDTKTIKNKMTSVRNIGKITKAMEMISVSKMKKSVARRVASSLFAEHSLDLLETLHTRKKLSHPYLEQRTGNKMLLIVIASNKGLCGGYNMNVSKQVTQFINTHNDKAIEVIAIGKQAQKIAFRNRLNIIASFTGFNDEVSAKNVRAVLQTAFDLYETDQDYASVHVAYTEFVSSLAFEARTLSLIPISLETSQHVLGNEHPTSLSADYVFEPSEQEVLDVVVPSLLMTIIYQLILDSLASEHSSRVTAMRNASDNAGEMLEDLRINYNRARQAGITQEIAEIVGGSSAMN